MFSSFVFWAFAAFISFAIVRWGPVVLRPACNVLMPMWLPLSVMIVAGFLLFATDQGRDLGVGLLGNGQSQLVLLALALFYWATGSWHTARLGLNWRFGPDRARWPDGYEAWLRWLPRLLGACAHFFAALSLAFAARHAIDPEQGPIIGFLPVSLIAFVPPAVIVAGTAILWLHDRRYVAERDAQAAIEAGADVDRSRARVTYTAARRRLRRAVGLLIAAALAIAALLFALGDRLPAGLASATLWVLASAALFLLVVSHRRAFGRWIVRHMSVRRAEQLQRAFEETDERKALSSYVLAASLSIIAVLVGVWTWWNPVALGNVAGSMVIGFFAFGAYIAVIDLLRILCGSGQRFAAVGVFLLLLAAGTSATRDFHRVRLCGDALAPCGASAATATTGGGSAAEAAVWTDRRPSVAEAARAWYAQAAADWPEGEPVPMLIVATAGGGIRAAYWTATVLEGLEEALGPDLFRRHLFAISGVSGGSVGAAAYAAYRAAAAEDPSAAEPPTALLDHDFLAPAIAATAFIDGPSSFLPELSQRDRGYALERAWEVATNDVLARPFLSFFPSRRELEGAAPWRPALLFNATHQDTGRRVITSHLKVERHVFLDSFDAHDLLKADMPASTAAHNSARFTYISPAGKLVPRTPEDGPGQSAGFLLDGGYFENFGAVTALQLVREARRAVGRDASDRDRVRPVILQISSDPSLTARDRARLDQEALPLCDGSGEETSFLPFQRGEWQGLRWKERDGGGWLSSFLNELTAPIAGIMASRVAHGTLASQELAHAICTERRSPPAETPPALDSLLTAVKPTPLPDAKLDVSDEGEPPPAPDRRPDYAHLAMCDDEGATVPPLGWVLSPLVRGQFAGILHEQCRNTAELNRLTAVFGRMPVPVPESAL